MGGVVSWSDGLVFDSRLWQNVQRFGMCGRSLCMLDMIVYLLGGSQDHNLGKFGLSLLVASSKWQLRTHWHNCHLSTLFFGSPLCLALSDGCFQGEVLLLQEILHSVAIDESVNDLVA